ncbi:hypothetical protein, partial [Acetobacter senegalensis]
VFVFVEFDERVVHGTTGAAVFKILVDQLFTLFVGPVSKLVQHGIELPLHLKVTAFARTVAGQNVVTADEIREVRPN